MIERAHARRIVAAELTRAYGGERAAGGGSAPAWVLDVARHDLGLLVTCRPGSTPPTDDPAPGPYLVDGLDGSLHRVLAPAGRWWEQDYRAVVRGERVPDPVDELAAEVRAIAAERGRLPALRELRRRVSTLDVAGARAYLTALETGAPLPDALLALAEDALPSPPDPGCLPGFETLTGPNPPTA